VILDSVVRDVLQWQPGPPGRMDLLNPYHPLLETSGVGIDHIVVVHCYICLPGQFLPCYLHTHLQSWKVGSKVAQGACAKVRGAWAIDVQNGGYGAAGAGADGDQC